ncbi:MAG: hypothetical protein MUD10_02605, partial [Candidatus Pacebacteria bacterium]|nr:hypothetical protein [Candidatus Paceibacterota bacterium]
MKLFKLLAKFVIGAFALVGFGLSAAYMAVSLHLTDTKGVIDEQSDAFWRQSKASAAAAPALVIGFSGMLADDGEEGTFFNKANYCVLKAVKTGYPAEFNRIFGLAAAGNQGLAQKNLDYLAKALNAAQDREFYTARQACASDLGAGASRKEFDILAGTVAAKSPLAWANTEEWEFFKAGVLKDRAILDRVEKETGIGKRLLVAELMAEQMRLFYSDRPTFKKAIAPLKVLGSMTEFSWGIFGIKPETAMKIEDNLKNPASAFYPGQGYSKMLDFKTANVRQERFSRITDWRDHYYAYLYAALFNK